MWRFGGLGVCSSKDAIWRYQLKVVVDKSVRLIIGLVILGFASQMVKLNVCQFRTNRETVTLSKIMLHPSFLSHSRKSQMKMATAVCHRPPIITVPSMRDE